MASPSDKVYVIEMPGRGRRPVVRPAPAGPAPTVDARRNAGHVGLRLLSTYALGPIAAAWWTRNPRRRIGWTVAAAAWVAGAVGLALRGDALGERLLAAPSGVAAWLIVAPGALLVLGWTWAAAIAAVVRGRPRPLDLAPKLRHALGVGVAGLALPGLGLFATGRAHRGRLAAGLPGLLAAAALVVARAPQVWDASRAVAAPGISGVALEMVLAGAVVIGALVVVSWIIQALDGARAVAPPRSLANGLSLALLVALFGLAATARPSSLARELDLAGRALAADGYRAIPLVLHSRAARLDPVEPGYAWRALALEEELGRWDDATARRAYLEKRAREWADGMRRAGAAPPQPAGRDAPTLAHASDGPWAALQSLYR